MKGHITPSEAGPSNLDAEKPKSSRKKQTPSNPSLELKTRTTTSKRKKDKSQGAELNNAVTEPPRSTSTLTPVAKDAVSSTIREC